MSKKYKILFIGPFSVAAYGLFAYSACTIMDTFLITDFLQPVLTIMFWTPIMLIYILLSLEETCPVKIKRLLNVAFLIMTVILVFALKEDIGESIEIYNKWKS